MAETVRERSAKKARIENENTTSASRTQQHPVWRRDARVSDFLCDPRWQLEKDSVVTTARFLKQEGITTLKDWMDNEEKRISTLDTIRRNHGLSVVVKITEALISEINEPLGDEARLDGHLLGVEGQRLTKETTEQDKFVRDAVSVKNPHRQVARLGQDIRLVLGPSGSGKTIYALNELALKEDEEQIDCPSERVCVYFSLQNHTPDEREQQKTKAAAMDDSIASDIQKMTTAAIKSFLGKSRDDEPGEKSIQLKMLLSVVLDEAAAFGPLMGKKEVLSSIFSQLRTVASHVRLIVVGTGMDGIAVGLSSSTDVLKYRMQPWDEGKLQSAVAGRGRSSVETRKRVEAISSSPILRKMITNARSAILTYESVAQINTGYFSVDLKGFIASIVHVVLGRYIARNGISGLDDSQRRRLAYTLFHELKEANESEQPRFPVLAKLEGCDAERIKRQALGLLDVHVESQAGVFAFLDDHKVSVSVTPAMSMLLYSLVGVEATVYDSWEGLEAVAGLHAVYLEVLSNTNTETKGVRLARLTRPIPAPSATKNFCIPSPNDTPTVYINGEKAPFFDAISVNRGLQSKYSKGGENIEINLAEELQKGGLVKERLQLNGKTGQKSQKTFDMGKAVMASFLRSWSSSSNQEDLSGSSAEAADPSPSDGNESTKVFSPAFLLPRSATAEVEVDPYSIICKITDDGIFYCSVNQQELKLTDPLFKETFTMIFLTNAKSISLKGNGSDGLPLKLLEDEIDRNGKVSGEKDEVFASLIRNLNLRDNVEIRFAFTR